MTRRPMAAAPNPGRGGDGRRRMWSESPIPRVATRRVRMAGDAPLPPALTYMDAPIGLTFYGWTITSNVLSGPTFESFVALAEKSVTLEVLEPSGGWPDTDPFTLYYVVGGTVVNTFTSMSSASPETGTFTLNSPWLPVGAFDDTSEWWLNLGTDVIPATARRTLWGNAEWITNGEPFGLVARA